MRSLYISDNDTVNERNGEVERSEDKGIDEALGGTRSTRDAGQNHWRKRVVSPTSKIVIDKRKRWFNMDHEI